MSRHANMIPFEAKYIHQTEGAVLVNIDGAQVWLPKIAIEYDEDELENAGKGNIISISIPEKLAIDKELI